MGFLNNLPEVLSQQRFLTLLQTYSQLLPGKTANPGLFLLLDNYNRHFGKYREMPELQAHVMKAVGEMKKRGEGWGEIRGKLPREVLDEMERKLDREKNTYLHASSPSLQSYREHSYYLYLDSTLRSKDAQNVPAVLAALPQIIPSLSLRTICKILETVTREEVYIPAEAVWAVERRFGSAGADVTLSDFNMLVKCLNAKVLYERISPGFWDVLAGNMVKSVTGSFPAGLCLNYSSRHLFFSPTLYTSLIPLWQTHSLQGHFNEFKEGLIGLCKSPFATPSLLSWGQTFALKHVYYLRGFDLVNILRGYMINACYNELFWEKLIGECEKRPLTEYDKLVLYHAMRGMEMDNPEWAERVLGKYKRLLEEVKATFNITFHPSRVSESEGELSKGLVESGLTIDRLKPLLSLYNCDFFLISLNTAVEFTGGPFHISQVDHSLDASTQAKLRHYRLSGFHSILLSELTDYKPLLQKAIDIIKAAKKPATLGIVGRDVGKTFTRLVDVDIVR